MKVKYGFTIYNHEIKKSFKKKDYTAEEVINKFFLMEGLDPNMEIALFRKVRNEFIKTIGSELRAGCIDFDAF